MSAQDDLKSALIPRLVRHEGLRLKPYRDTAGKLTIGVGRNLTDVGISEAEANLLLGNDIDAAVVVLDREWPWWRAVGPVRGQVMVELVFNTGPGALRQFTQFLAAMRASDFAAAAADVLNSAWAEQVGARARELAAMVRTGAAS